MNTILIVFKKEVTDTLRDKRTLFTSILLPALLIPLLLLGVGKFQKNILDQEKSKQITVAFVGADKFTKDILVDSTIMPTIVGSIEAAKNSIQRDQLDALIEFEKGYYDKVANLQTGVIKVYYKSTNLTVKSRIMDRLDILSKTAMAQRIAQLKVAEETLVPIQIQPNDIASRKEQIGVLVGGFIPYIFILFSYMGCMYPALDLITGEKEKKTLETLLTVPASRFYIMMGKVITIAFFGLLSATMSILGLLFSISLATDLPPELLQTTQEIVGFKFILMLFLMLVPLTLFFAGAITSLIIGAKTFKEAQSIVTPLSFVVIIPAMLALMPGMELSWKNVWIPILNVALATKQIIGETIQIGQYIAIVVSLCILAIGAVYISYGRFSNEKMIINS